MNYIYSTRSLFHDMVMHNVHTLMELSHVPRMTSTFWYLVHNFVLQVHLDLTQCHDQIITGQSS